MGAEKDAKTNADAWSVVLTYYNTADKAIDNLSDNLTALKALADAKTGGPKTDVDTQIAALVAKLDSKLVDINTATGANYTNA